VEYTETDAGYAVEGTPADCVAVADVALGLDPDVVVSGCNHGPNIGAHILGSPARSAPRWRRRSSEHRRSRCRCVSRGNLPVPPTLDNGDFAVAGEVVVDLLDRAETGSEGPSLPFGADVLNVNVPAADDEAAADPTYRLTEPACAASST